MDQQEKEQEKEIQLQQQQQINQKNIFGTLIQISQLGAKYTKNSLIQINLSDALQNYQENIKDHSIREWAQYVEGYSYCLKKQYGLLRQDLNQLHSSMMRKELFYGENNQPQKSPIKQQAQQGRKRVRNKEPEQQILYSAKNVLEQLEYQSDSSISNPRNLAPVDLLRLQEDQQLVQFEQHFEEPNQDQYNSNSNSIAIQQQVIQDLRDVEQQTFQDVLQQRRNKQNGVKNYMSQSPDQKQLPRILINNEQIVEQINLEQKQNGEQNNFDVSSQDGLRDIYIMKEFNQLMNLNGSQEQNIRIESNDQKQNRKNQQGKVIVDEQCQFEIQYQENLEVLLQANEKIDDLNARMTFLNFQSEFWKENDNLFKEIDQVQFNLDQLNTDVTYRRSNKKRLNLFQDSEQATEQIQNKTMIDDIYQQDIQPFDHQEQEYPDSENVNYDQFTKQQEIELNLQELKLNENPIIYQKILFDLSIENDEQTLTFDQYLTLRNKKSQVNQGKAFYDLLVMARLGKILMTDSNENRNNFSLIEIKIL